MKNITLQLALVTTCLITAGAAKRNETIDSVTVTSDVEGNIGTKNNTVENNFFNFTDGVRNFTKIIADGQKKLEEGEAVLKKARAEGVSNAVLKKIQFKVEEARASVEKMKATLQRTLAYIAIGCQKAEDAITERGCQPEEKFSREMASGMKHCQNLFKEAYPKVNQCVAKHAVEKNKRYGYSR